MWKRKRTGKNEIERKQVREKKKEKHCSRVSDFKHQFSM